MNICKYWKEYDGENGRLYEFCKLINKVCYCCGTLKQCDYKWKSMPIRTFFIILFTRGINYITVIHWIFPKIKGTHINTCHNIKGYRKYYRQVGWALIKEGLINILSGGIYTADYGINTAFEKHPDNKKEK